MGYLFFLRRRRRIALLVTALTVAALTLPLWLPAIGTALVVADPLVPADAVVPLAGGDTRVRYAVDVLAAEYGRWFVATDILRRGPPDALASKENADLALKLGVPPNRLRATTQVVHSTYQELQALAALARRESWHSLIIVTSAQHTRRTSLLAARVFAHTGVTVIVRPVLGYGEDPAAWWRSGDTRSFTLREYGKLIALCLGYYG
jgi:uncharacterized SAM-binding protein YcdF (DUF218 family)